MQKLILSVLLLAVFNQELLASGDWVDACSRMPLKTNVLAINLASGVPILLNSFQSNDLVKAIAILPSATDDLHFHDRGMVSWSNSVPSLTDAIQTLTNRTGLKATFRPPVLFLHTTNDTLLANIVELDSKYAEKLRQMHSPASLTMIDAHWPKLSRALNRSYGIDSLPQVDSTAWWHFYRSYFAEYGLSARETLAIVCVTANISCTIKQDKVVFSDLNIEKKARSIPGGLK